MGLFECLLGLLSLLPGVVFPLASLAALFVRLGDTSVLGSGIHSTVGVIHSTPAITYSTIGPIQDIFPLRKCLLTQLFQLLVSMPHFPNNQA